MVGLRGGSGLLILVFGPTLGPLYGLHAEDPTNTLLSVPLLQLEFGWIINLRPDGNVDGDV